MKIAIATLLLATLAAIAAASTIPALHARPVDPADDVTCYEWAPGDARVSGLKRLCAGVALVDVALPLNSSGTKTVTFSAARPTSAHVMACHVYAVSGSGTIAIGAEKSMTTFGAAFQAIALDPITATSTGTLWARCQMEQGARLLSFSVSPD